MYQQRFHGIADAGTLALGIDGNRQGHLEVRGLIDIGVTYALVVLDHRHMGLLGDGTDQGFAAARDHQVHVVHELNQFPDRFTVGRPDKLHGMLRHPLLHAAGNQRVGNDRVGMNRLFAASQDHGIGCLETERGRIRRNVRA